MNQLLVLFVTLFRSNGNEQAQFYLTPKDLGCDINDKMTWDFNLNKIENINELCEGGYVYPELCEHRCRFSQAYVGANCDGWEINPDKPGCCKLFTLKNGPFNYKCKLNTIRESFGELKKQLSDNPSTLIDRRILESNIPNNVKYFYDINGIATPYIDANKELYLVAEDLGCASSDLLSWSFYSSNSESLCEGGLVYPELCRHRCRFSEAYIGTECNGWLIDPNEPGCCKLYTFNNGPFIYNCNNYGVNGPYGEIKKKINLISPNQFVNGAILSLSGNVQYNYNNIGENKREAILIPNNDESLFLTNSDLGYNKGDRIYWKFNELTKVTEYELCGGGYVYPSLCRHRCLYNNNPIKCDAWLINPIKPQCCLLYELKNGEFIYESNDNLQNKLYGEIKQCVNIESRQEIAGSIVKTNGQDKYVYDTQGCLQQV